MKIPTVNVIEMVDDMVVGMSSFPTNVEGNIEAQKLFTKICKENTTLSEREIKVCMGDGIVKDLTWKVLFVYST